MEWGCSGTEGSKKIKKNKTLGENLFFNIFAGGCGDSDTGSHLGGTWCMFVSVVFFFGLKTKVIFRVMSV